ncbi:MAG TPA: fumarylacetoacetase [Rhodothermales bacterium]|nr:fumarylacetoacetase [Rhodothermales bacterium]
MRSFLDLPADTPFPLQNLPYGVFSRRGSGAPRVGVAVGTLVLDLAVLEAEGLLAVPELKGAHVFGSGTLNPFMAAGRGAWRAVRARLQDLLAADGDDALRESPDLQAKALVPQREATMHLPAEIGDYTDFYASRQHATNVGVMFRGRDNALMPNWLHLPVGYHGRASSIVVSGTPVRRPLGQTRPSDDAPPVFGPSKQLDFELEMGTFVGVGNAQGTPIAVGEADDHLFGYALVNDWSARDVQRWEYVPLGPFLAKNFATTVAPWVVPAEAMVPFRVAGEPQDASAGNPEPLPYLRQPEPRALDVTLEVRLETERMRREGVAPAVISRSNARNLYWSFQQQLAHHTVGGCNMRPGDLLASGTISGDDEGGYGSLLEISWRGERPVALPSGETRAFLQDGDRLIVAGWAEGDGYRVGFGEAEGLILPAREA